jgi:putative transport protein
MAHLFTFLKDQPLVLLFVVVGGGLLLAKIRIARINPGVVAGTLIFGLLLSLAAAHVADVSLELPSILQGTFFNLYIFAVGLRVGPQCFAGLERGARQFLLVALVALVATPAVALLCGWVFHLDAGTLAGVLAGSNTASASFGAAQSAVQSGAAGPTAAALAVNLSVSFAIAYALSLVGFIVALPLFPKLTHSNARAAALQAESELGEGAAPLPQTPEALRPGYVPVDLRAYRITKPRGVGRSVSALVFEHPRLTIEGIRRQGRMLPVTEDLVTELGDEVAITGGVEDQIRLAEIVGPEIDATELRDFEPETADVVISQRTLVGKTLDDLLRGSGHGVFFKAAFRMGEPIPVKGQTTLKRGDVLRVTGVKKHVDALAAAAGGVIKASSITDLLTVAAGMVIGGLLGAAVVPVGDIRIGMGTTAGLLVVGIVLGWLRTRHPRLGGPVPEPARQLLEDLGLSIFVASVGLSAGPGLVDALGAGRVAPIVGAALLVGFAPPIVAWLLGIFVLKTNAAVLLGAITGARQSSPGLKVIQDSIHSTMPAIGFPVPFTITTIAFTLYGYLVMVFWPIR